MGGEEKWRERGAKCLLLASWRYRGTRMISLVTRADPSCSGEVEREGLWVGDIGRGRGGGGCRQGAVAMATLPFNTQKR